MNIAIIGATGAVGRMFLKELEELNLDFNLTLFASEKSSGKPLKFKNSEIIVNKLDLNSFTGIDFILMSAGGEVSKKISQELSKNSIVIDNSSAWRMKPDVPLVVPEVNKKVIKNFKSGIIANPNCSTIQLAVSLKPLYDFFGISSVDVSTYQSVSGSGQKGINELSSQIDLLAKNKSCKPEKYQKQIAYNVLPAIDVLDNFGHCFEEEKMVKETKKIFNDQDIDIFATTARVPVYYCHSEAVTVHLKRVVSRADVIDVMNDMPGLVLITEDDYQKFPTPIDVKGDKRVFVSRIRLPFGKDRSNIVQFWNVADNLLKGAATNAVQILKSLI